MRTNISEPVGKFQSISPTGHTGCNVEDRKPPNPRSVMTPNRSRQRRLALIRLLTTNPFLTEAEARQELGLSDGEWRDSPNGPDGGDDHPPSGEGALRKPPSYPGSPFLSRAS